MRSLRGDLDAETDSVALWTTTSWKPVAGTFPCDLAEDVVGSPSWLLAAFFCAEIERSIPGETALVGSPLGPYRQNEFFLPLLRRFPR